MLPPLLAIALALIFRQVLVGMSLGDIPTAYGMSLLITIVAGTLVRFGVLRIFGQRVES